MRSRYSLRPLGLWTGGGPPGCVVLLAICEAAAGRLCEACFCARTRTGVCPIPVATHVPIPVVLEWGISSYRMAASWPSNGAVDDPPDTRDQISSARSAPLCCLDRQRWARIPTDGRRRPRASPEWDDPRSRARSYAERRSLRTRLRRGCAGCGGPAMSSQQRCEDRRSNNPLPGIGT